MSPPEGQEAAPPIRRRGLIQRAHLDPDALFVVQRLQRHGHEAYLVGGCVRDLIAGLEPKDFDVATDARPNRIKGIFRSARVIGRRFRLAHVHFPGGHIVETSTFRGSPEPADEEPEPQDVEGPLGPPRAPRAPEGARPSENVFGTAPEDARRRDFTVNALFYDPVRDEVIDWVGGLSDIDARVIRAIGVPEVRLREDPVRMIRAVHFAERMGFTLEPTLEAAIRVAADEIENASGARLYVEIHKVLGRGHARGTFRRLYELGVLRHWLPELCDHLDGEAAWPTADGGTHEEASRGEPEDLPAAHATWNLLGAADRWGLAAHRAPESLGMAALFGPWLLEARPADLPRGVEAFLDFLEDAFRPVARRMSVPRRVVYRLAEILAMLVDLRHPPPPRRIARMVHRPSFGEAMDLFRLDLMARDGDLALLDAWEQRAREAGGRRGERGGGRHRGAGRGTEREHGAHGRPPAVAPEADAWDAPPPPPGPSGGGRA
jgi:poly(A) polymerase